MDLGLLPVNTLNEFGILGTPSTGIRRPTDGFHWSAPDNVFGKATLFGMSAERSDQEYNYKTDSEICRENQDFGRQNILMSQLPLDSTPIGTNTTNVIMSQFDSNLIGTKTLDPNPLTQPT